MSRTFSAKSLGNLNGIHPLLREIADAALQSSPVDFSVICGNRSREDQEKAFKEGHSKVHYGDSAHTAQSPDGKPRACGIDVLPYPFTNYDDPAMGPKWKAIFLAFQAEAQKRGIKLRWGGGIPDITFAWDLPHIELHPWRTYAKQP